VVGVSRSWKTAFHRRCTGGGNRDGAARRAARGRARKFRRSTLPLVLRQGRAWLFSGGPRARRPGAGPPRGARRGRAARTLCFRSSTGNQNSEGGGLWRLLALCAADSILSGDPGAASRGAPGQACARRVEALRPFVGSGAFGRSAAGRIVHPRGTSACRGMGDGVRWVFVACDGGLPVRIAASRGVPPGRRRSRGFYGARSFRRIRRPATAGGPRGSPRHAHSVERESGFEASRRGALLDVGSAPRRPPLRRARRVAGPRWIISGRGARRGTMGGRRSRPRPTGRMRKEKFRGEKALLAAPRGRGTG
jgi:hypothetical protein